ncbi:MAG: hypothetical protein A2514_06610 [Gammaproteobacteria bacterium RIFOXYD12_FULL_61_37]|nr:MAG: hypothetical protein A2514_06610 [Gammaproteobacteria bacterium RIFOXYD12_FULL_61_37]
MAWSQQKQRHNLPDPLQRAPENSLLLRLFLFLGIVVAPHLTYIDGSFTAAFFLLLLYRVISVFKPRLLPRRSLLLLMTIGGFALFFFRTHTIIGAEAGVSLLVLMSGLKVIELRWHRDLQFSVLLGYFILITVFLFDSSMPVAIAMFLAAVGLTSVLIDSSRISLCWHWSFGLRRAFALSVQALPLTLVLFFFFPRFSGPLWSINMGEKIARTGLSDTLSPGSVSQLILSKEIAFRVEFKGSLPPPQQRYWRGPVLWMTDGLQWNRSQQMMREITDRVDPISSSSYTVYLEPSNNPWLILLDLPGVVPKDAVLTQDYQVLTQYPVSSAKRYEAESFPRFAPLSLHPVQSKLGLQLPDNISPRVKTLAENWRSNSSSPGDVVLKALQFFNQGPFVYTLRPPLLGNDPIDEFLFESRQGFCEHFATSFTILMRLAGIPSRLVTGYQGGELNPRGNYLIVRQSDAHAWSEVWLAGQGWTRVDPTAAVAPERIERSLDLDANSAEGDAAIFAFNDSGIAGILARNVRWGLDSFNLSWQRWIIGYDRNRQRGLLAGFGLEWMDMRLLGFFSLGLSAISFVILYFFISNSGSPPSDPVSKAYALFCRRLAQIGITRQGHEGPLDFKNRVISERPDLSDDVERIINRYIALRFQKEAISQRNYLIRMVHKFRPKAART